jgi:uncharacterized RDD family membrane protein YckC
MPPDSALSRFPRVPLGRRTAAFAIDAGLAWLLSSPLGAVTEGFPLAQLVIFAVLWLITRVLVVYQNRGQSLGRWMFDMKVVTLELGRIPGLFELSQREGVTGLGVFCAGFALLNLAPTNAGVILLIFPILVDCGAAWLDSDVRQAFHDRIAQTTIVATKRGYSLDLKIKRLLAEVSGSMKK